MYDLGDILTDSQNKLQNFLCNLYENIFNNQNIFIEFYMRIPCTRIPLQQFCLENLRIWMVSKVKRYDTERESCDQCGYLICYWEEGGNSSQRDEEGWASEKNNNSVVDVSGRWK